MLKLNVLVKFPVNPKQVEQRNIDENPANEINEMGARLVGGPGRRYPNAIKCQKKVNGKNCRDEVAREKKNVVDALRGIRKQQVDEQPEYNAEDRVCVNGDGAWTHDHNREYHD
jgi:hypothetical protein